MVGATLGGPEVGASLGAVVEDEAHEAPEPHS